MTEKQITELALIFKTLGHPARLKIALGLAEKTECNVSKMVEKLGLPQPAVSQHLAALKNAGIIEGVRKGGTTCYRLAENAEALRVLKASGAKCGGK
ncbi:MAG: metalloregulator ArsR/SmtB family transcription factor [Elusimicrobiaceae bacterium]|jgi:ArsR family transcriptional regulator